MTWTVTVTGPSRDVVDLPAGIAAGHPVTAEVGLRILTKGGSAADAAVAAVLASCVAESIMTGIAGGGFATYYEAASGTVTCLDFFVAVPGLDGRAPAAMTPVAVKFGDIPLQYAIGAPSAAVPGVPAGLGEIHARWGRLPWHTVVSPAVDVARTGVIMLAEHARALTYLAPAMTYGEGAAIYAPQGQLLSGGELVHHPGMDRALALLAEEGPDVFYTGTIGQRIAETVDAGGGALSVTDLAAYRVLEPPVTRAHFAGTWVYGRTDLNRTIDTLQAISDLASHSPRDRAVIVADALRSYAAHRLGDTTNTAVVDPEGNACVVTTTLGLGAGVWVPGLGIHLNSMLGEGELISSEIRPGMRMSSMMCPLVVTSGPQPGSLLLAAGAAGASRIRTALVHTLIGVFVDGLNPYDAVARPRFHVVGRTVHAEPGVPPEQLAVLENAGYKVHRWREFDHYFGGASAVGQGGAAGDPRRGGVGLVL